MRNQGLFGDPYETAFVLWKQQVSNPFNWLVAGEAFVLSLPKPSPVLNLVEAEVTAAKGGGTLLNASEKYVVIGKYPDYINFASKYKNASVLDLPNKWAHLPKQEAAKFLLKQNSSQLRGALRNGFIPFDIGYGGQFYNAEKLILGNKGLSLQGNIWIK